MTIDEAIIHCEEVANDRAGCCEDCAEEHRQLACWLKELKQYREQTDGDLVSRFRDYQIEWLTSHDDLDLKETDMLVVQFLKDTAECFLKTELPSAEKTTLCAEKTTIKDADLIHRSSVITMLQKIENAVEDGDGFQFNEWVEYAKDIPSETPVIVSDTKFYDDYKAELDIRKKNDDLISRDYVLSKFKEQCDRCGKYKEYNGVMCSCCALDDAIDYVEDAPSAEKTDSFIPQEDVAGILNTVESALKGTNYEVVGYDNTDGFLKVLIDVK